MHQRFVVVVFVMFCICLQGLTFAAGVVDVDVVQGHIGFFVLETIAVVVGIPRGRELHLYSASVVSSKNNVDNPSKKAMLK